MRRRRSYNKRPEPARRTKPVIFECIDPPDRDTITVALGNERYEFHEDGQRRLVTSVAVEAHIACFLARPEMYRAV